MDNRPPRTPGNAYADYSGASDDEIDSSGELDTPEPELDLVEARDKCSQVLNLMYSLGLRLDQFLDHVCYGNVLCRQPSEMRTARKHLRTSPLLSGILDRLHTVPRTSSKGKKVAGATEPLETWAVSTAARIYRAELLSFAEAMKCNVEEIVNEETLKDLTFQSILEVVEERCTRLFEMLMTICEGKRKDAQKRTEKDSTFVSTNKTAINNTI
jgi:hypothetical protein